MQQNALGEYLRGLRQQRGLTQQQFAERAQVSRRAVVYWETQGRTPRDIELQNALLALEVSAAEKDYVSRLLASLRRAHMSEGMVEPAPWSDFQPEFLPDLGDLLRALRLRRGWDQQRLANGLGVRRATVNRWENHWTIPSVDVLERTYSLLGALPEERTALRLRQLSPSVSWEALTLPTCLEQVAQYGHLIYRTHRPLVDLQTLVLQRQLALLPPSEDVNYCRVNLDTIYSSWLFQQDRLPESRRVAVRALNRMRKELPPHRYLAGTLNLVCSHISQGPGQSSASLRLLEKWRPLFVPQMLYTLLGDMALECAMAGWQEEAWSMLAQTLKTAQKTAGRFSEPDLSYYRLTQGKILIRLGRPAEALDWLLKPLKDETDLASLCHRLIWIEGLLKAGETSAATRQLTLMGSALEHYSWPRLQRKWQEKMLLI